MKFVLRVFLFVLLTFVVPLVSFAATTGQAWGENVGWIDFSSTAGAITVTDTAISGYAYGYNVGWINLGTVTNTNGVLSGYAWGENVGWIDFSRVTINTSTGVFSGHAYGYNIGWIVFDTSSPVTTSWRPTVTAPTPSTSGSRSSSSGGGGRYVPFVPPTATTTATTSITRRPLFNTPLFLKNLSADVSLLQSVLTRLGHYNGPITGYYGLLTEAAVKKYQISKGIAPLGFVGISTRASLNAETLLTTMPAYDFKVDLFQGSIHPDVKALQKLLNLKGYTVTVFGKETTYFGSKTREALIKFQRANNISPPIGSFSSTTRMFINNLK